MTNPNRHAAGTPNSIGGQYAPGATPAAAGELRRPAGIDPAERKRIAATAALESALDAQRLDVLAADIRAHFPEAATLHVDVEEEMGRHVLIDATALDEHDQPIAGVDRLAPLINARRGAPDAIGQNAPRRSADALDFTQVLELRPGRPAVPFDAHAIASALNAAQLDQLAEAIRREQAKSRPEQRCPRCDAPWQWRVDIVHCHECGWAPSR